MSTKSKTQFPASVEWLGKVVPGYGTKELQVRVWKMVLDYEKSHQTIIGTGSKNNVLLTLPGVSGYTRPVSIGGLLEVFGIPRYTADQNGAYHPRQAAKVLMSVGYELQLSEATSKPATLAKSCPKCKNSLPQKAKFCYHCGTKQPEMEVKAKGKAPTVEVKPKSKPRRSNKPTGKATLTVTPHPEKPITLPDLPIPAAEEVKPEVVAGSEV